MEITNNNYNTMPEQVQENKDNIKVLAEYIKEAYNATTTLETRSTTINASMVRDWVAGTTKGFILDQAGKLFKIVAVSDNTIFIQWWASLPQGATGATGARGETGAKGDKGDAGVGFNNTTDINLVVGEPLSVTYDTEDGITITSQGGIEANGQTFTPTVENNVPIIAGNGLTMDATEDGKHVDVHLSAETQSTLARALKMPTSAVHETKLVAIDNTNAQTMLSIGDGLSVENGALKSTASTPKYQHNIMLYSSGSSTFYVNISIVNNNAQPFESLNAIAQWLKDHNITSSNLYCASGKFIPSGATVVGCYANSSGTMVYLKYLVNDYTKETVTIDGVEKTFITAHNIKEGLPYDIVSVTSITDTVLAL